VNQRANTIRNTLFSSVGIYTEYILGMMVSIIMARHLGPDDFGTYSLIVWLVACGVTATNAGTTTTMIKFIAELRGSERNDLLVPMMAYLRRTQAKFLVVVLVLGSAAFLMSGARLAPGFNHLALCGLMVAAVGLRAPYMLNIAVAKGFERFGATATIALVSTPINLAMIVVAWAIHASIEVFLGIFGVSSVLFYAVSKVQVASFVPEGSSDAIIPPELMSRVHRHMRFVAVISTVAFFTASETEVLFLTLLDTPASAGQFKVAYQLATGAALLLPGVFSAILLPMMARAFSEGRAIAARRFVASTTYLSLLAAPLVGFGMVFSSATIQLLYGDAYRSADLVLTGCLFASSINVIGSAAQSLLMSADQQHSVLARVLGCGVLKVVLDIVLIGRFGLLGGTAAYVSVSIIGVIVTVALAVRVGGVNLAWRRLGRILLAITLASLIALPFKWIGHPIVAILAGMTVLGFSYAILSLLLGCWSRPDIDYLRSLQNRIAGGQRTGLNTFLDWAETRAIAEAP